MEQQQLSLSIIEDLKGKGFNQSQIAEMFGKSRQAVSWHKTRYGGRRTPREIVMDAWPFDVPRAMGQTHPFRRLRDHAEYMVTGGKGMPADKLKRLRSFYKRMENEVLEFDPNIGPIDGVSRYGGWAYRTRRASDADLLIRVNEYTNLTEEARMIWRFPPEIP